MPENYDLNNNLEKRYSFSEFSPNIDSDINLINGNPIISTESFFTIAKHNKVGPLNESPEELWQNSR